MKNLYFYLICASVVMLVVVLVILFPIPVYNETKIVPSRPAMEIDTIPNPQPNLTNKPNIIFETEQCDISCKKNHEAYGETCQIQRDGNYLCKAASRFADGIIIPWGAANSTFKHNFVMPDTTVSIEINNTVIWTNGDDYQHMIQSDEGLFGPVKILPNASWGFVFNKTGTYHYHGNYPWLHGTITVVGFDPNYNFVPPLFKGTNSPEVYYYLFRESDSFWYIKSIKVLDNNTISTTLSDYHNNIWTGNSITKTFKVGDSFIGNCGNFAQNSEIEYLTLERITTKPTAFAEFKDQTGKISNSKCIFEDLEK